MRDDYKACSWAAWVAIGLPIHPCKAIMFHATTGPNIGNSLKMSKKCLWACLGACPEKCQKNVHEYPIKGQTNV